MYYKILDSNEKTQDFNLKKYVKKTAKYILLLLFWYPKPAD